MCIGTLLISADPTKSDHQIGVVPLKISKFPMQGVPNHYQC